ncbi:hypothetical protein EZY14_009050 [Kordia sp. TARA_039_SRF]|nr:hypothetical protein EZY14_009050 [Kordia sp. TARA_039_SRF]
MILLQKVHIEVTLKQMAIFNTLLHRYIDTTESTSREIKQNLNIIQLVYVRGIKKIANKLSSNKKFKFSLEYYEAVAVINALEVTLNEFESFKYEHSVLYRIFEEVDSKL